MDILRVGSMATRNDLLNRGELEAPQRARIERARAKATILYEGKETAHRSCGICLAETFALPWRPYQALRRGGITGEGSCGAVRAGEMVLGELLGPDGPTDPPPERLKIGMQYYQERWKEI